MTEEPDDKTFFTPERFAQEQAQRMESPRGKQAARMISWNWSILTDVSPIPKPVSSWYPMLVALMFFSSRLFLIRCQT
jgi:hypothetical protein